MYGNANEIIYDCLDVLEPYIEKVIPKYLEEEKIFHYMNIEIDIYSEQYFELLEIT